MEHQRKQTPQGMLLDMDGTLLLTTQHAEQTWLSVFEEFQPLHHQAPERLQRYMREVHTTYKHTIADDDLLQRRDRLHPFVVRTELVEQVLAQVDIVDTDLATSMVRVYETQRDYHRQLSPSALETLGRLRQQSIRLALLTNGNATYQRRKLEQHRLISFFDCIFIEEEFGVGKTDTRIYQAALESLHLTAKETWMVGDNLYFDVEVPQRLSIFAFWFDPHNQGLPLQSHIHPDGIIHTLPEIFQHMGHLERNKRKSSFPGEEHSHL